MTGIERLHKLIADIDVNADPGLWYILRGGTEGDWDCEEHDDKTLDSTLAAIADQIKREQSCDRDTLSIRAERMSGELWLKCGEHEVEGTVEEIEAAMMLMDRLKSLGVEVGDETITVPLRKGDDER